MIAAARGPEGSGRSMAMADCPSGIRPDDEGLLQAISVAL
jgi:hypothetical protein